MRLVERADKPPAKCVVSGFSDGPFIDCEARFPYIDPYVYVSVDSAREMGKLIGMVDGSELQEAQANNVELEREVTRLKQEAEEADKFAESVEYTLSKFDTSLRHKPGPKTRKKVAA